MSGTLTRASDAFSFGVLIFQVRGRSAAVLVDLGGECESWLIADDEN